MAAHNDKLRAAREATPSRWFPGRAMTRSELAHLVVEHVWFHERIEAPLDRKYIAKLELGVIRHPNARYRRALRDILDARDDLDLGFVSRNTQRVAPSLAGGPSTGPGAIDLRELGAVLSGHRPPDVGTAAMVGRLWRDDGPGAPAGGDAPVDEEPVHELVARARTAALLDRLLAEARADAGSADRADLRADAERVRLAAGAEAAGRQLLGGVAELCQRWGLAALDAGDRSAASDYFVVGVRAAHLAASSAFAAHLLSLLAYPPPAVAGRGDGDDQRLLAPGPAHAPAPGADELDEIVRWAASVCGRARVANGEPDRRLLAFGRLTELAR